MLQLQSTEIIRESSLQAVTHYECSLAPMLAVAPPRRIRVAPEPKHILVIDGGALRGLANLLVIDHIMKAVIARCRKVLLPCEVFHLIGGTSVGGFISGLLGRLGLDCASAITYYEDAIKILFNNKSNEIWSNVAKHRTIDTAEFDKYLDKIVKDRAGSPDVLMKVDDDGSARIRPKTFIMLMEGAPDYPTNCARVIRSYDVQEPKTLPHTNYGWTISQAMRAAVSSPIYISPFSIKAANDCERQFQDAGFCGYNNPISAALHEFDTCWPQDRIGTIVSFGTGLQDFLPKNPPRLEIWAPQPSHVLKLSKELLSEKLTEEDRKRGNASVNVIWAIRALACMATDSMIAHRRFEEECDDSCDNYYRIDEPFGLQPFDLVDTDQVQLVREQVGEWMRNGGSELVAEIASKLVDESEEFTDKEAATYITPPSPPLDVVKGYNPQLDEPRPTRIEDYLRKYEVLFIVDDSGSMSGDRWKETRDALTDIAEYAFKLNVHTVSLRFFNTTTYVRGLQGKAKVLSLFDRVDPNCGTPTGAVLNTVFGQHLGRIDTAVRKGEAEYSKILPLDIIVLTDGVPTDNPAEVVSRTVKRLKSSHYHPNTMGVQFVQIGNEEQAKSVLSELTRGDNAGLVDTVPYRGVVTPEMLLRILLGGVHPNIRLMLPIDMLAQ